MLTNLESVFRSLKTDLGLRPVFHQIDRRVEGSCSSACWPTTSCTHCACNSRPKARTTAGRRCARRLPTQQRVTATMQRRDGRAVHVRKATRPEPRQQKINAMLGLSPNPGGTHRVLV